MKRVVLLGLERAVVQAAADQVRAPGLTLEVATSLVELRACLSGPPVEAVVIGAGLPLETRLEAVREVLGAGGPTTVHLKAGATGPAGYAPFAQQVLDGVRGGR